MNVLRILLGVVKSVPIPLVPMSADVMLDIVYMLMHIVAMVIDIFIGNILMITLLVHATDIDECVEGTHQCAQNCHNNIGSYTCSCRDGYRLNVDERACDGKPYILYLSLISKYLVSPDINECAEATDGCGQICTNTVGSYHCSCTIGYRLDPDGHGCNGA